MSGGRDGVPPAWTVPGPGDAPGPVPPPRSPARAGPAPGLAGIPVLPLAGFMFFWRVSAGPRR